MVWAIGLAALGLMGQEEGAPPGQLTAVGKDGKPGILVPLKATSVEVDIAGVTARVNVVQTFENPSRVPIEAVYTFPLSNDAAVDRMRMNVAGRVVVGQIKRREEARRIYDQAKAAGQVASLLDQERPNVFTQSVANILPGAQVQIEISYVQTLKVESGAFEFSFPMVVGPRYMPASTPDPKKIQPQYVPKELRTGSTVSLSVHLDAGAAIQSVTSVLHEVDTKMVGGSGALVSLKRKDEIPNRDFILRYKLKATGIQEQLVTHKQPDGSGEFCVVLNPPAVVEDQQIRAREVVFVMDQSGSQSGFPIEKSKVLTKALMDHLRTADTFNVIAFSSGLKRLWPEPRSFAEQTVAEAKKFVDALQADGGTEFLPAIDLALSTPPAGGRVRLVVFNTDGFIGNEFEVLNRIQKYRQNARMFTFGIGNGVNKFLIDAMSVEGRGGSETVTLAEDADRAVQRFLARTQSPVLTDVKVEYEGLEVSDLSPAAVPDVFAGQPVVLTGRFARVGKGNLVISGKVGGDAWSREVPIDFGAAVQGGSGVASLWARRKIEDLTRSDWLAQTRGTATKSAQDIIDLSLRYGVMSAYTSFVAVEQKVVNVGGKQVTVAVPVEVTDGVAVEKQILSVKSTGPATLGRGAGGGFGGGGFSGGSGGRPAAKAGGQSSDEKASKQPSQPSDPLAKVASSLRAQKEGIVTVQVLLSKLDKSVLTKLKSAGLKLDDSDAALKVAFGTVDAKKLLELAKIDEVVEIRPIEG